MLNNNTQEKSASHTLISALTYAMFFMFAMTTDAVGEIIKIAKSDMGLTNTQASAFHWSTMIAIALSGVGLGFVADRIGRKNAILIGLGAYAFASAMFMMGESFYLYFVLLFVSGLAIGLFKTAALALIGDISTSTEHHTAKMNAVEGFFGIGAIIGPMLVVALASAGLSWTWLYLIAAGLCVVMMLAALFTKYPDYKIADKNKATLGHTLSLLKNKYALGFSFGIAMYVAAEVAIFVWLPTFLVGFEGSKPAMWFAAYAVMIFFVLRAVGRFLGAWILQHFDWKPVILCFSAIIFCCFLGSAIIGKNAAVYLLPLSGLFMSMIYPTLNSKGISCFPKTDHGAVAGLILFFTAASAAIGPILMAFVSDQFGGGDMRIGFLLATGFTGVLFLLALYNWKYQPAERALSEANETEYGAEGVAT
ncbi:MFS transporter [Hirschia litorea]|uniref:MFS transporter n=1 Tax=Hirschia litorea TaxID=1199156 RepID=A0ABW2IHQ7_9PROT